MLTQRILALRFGLGWALCGAVRRLYATWAHDAATLICPMDWDQGVRVNVVGGTAPWAARGGSLRLVAAGGHLRLALTRLARAGLGLALAAHAGRLIALAAPRLRENTVLLDFSGESLQRDFK